MELSWSSISAGAMTAAVSLGSSLHALGTSASMAAQALPTATAGGLPALAHSASTAVAPAAPTLPPLPDRGRAPPVPPGPRTDGHIAARSAEAEARREAESAERRRVIANNKAWKAAEVVRRQWLTGLLARRTVPAGTEVLIARAVVGREYTLSHAMEHGHEVLMNLLGVVPVEREAASYYGNRAMCAQVLDQATTPKAALMRTLAAVVAAWEQRADTHTWRNPTEWDDVIMTTLIGWGYPASDVERLLLRSVSADAAR